MNLACDAKCMVLMVRLPCSPSTFSLSSTLRAPAATGHGQTKRGFSRLEWQKLRERNAALDCRVYARAAAWIAGADRWTDAMWRNLEEQVGVSRRTDREHSIEEEGIDPVAGKIRRQPQRHGRRVFRSSYLG
jgi:phage terminase large subunit GpA-like protein